MSVHKGRIPEKDGEIAIDRKFADSADLKVGDKVTLDKKNMRLQGWLPYLTTVHYSEAIRI